MNAIVTFFASLFAKSPSTTVIPAVEKPTFAPSTTAALVKPVKERNRPRSVTKVSQLETGKLNVKRHIAATFLNSLSWEWKVLFSTADKPEVAVFDDALSPDGVALDGVEPEAKVTHSDVLPAFAAAWELARRIGNEVDAEDGKGRPNWYTKMLQTRQPGGLVCNEREAEFRYAGRLMQLRSNVSALTEMPCDPNDVAALTAAHEEAERLIATRSEAIKVEIAAYLKEKASVGQKAFVAEVGKMKDVDTETLVESVVEAICRYDSPDALIRDATQRLIDGAKARLAKGEYGAIDAEVAALAR